MGGNSRTYQRSEDILTDWVALVGFSDGLLQRASSSGSMKLSKLKA
jgi:hypothetical protein